MSRDDKMDSGMSSGGTDWEVVSLTRSMYAAAPGPVGVEAPNESVNTESAVKVDKKTDKEDFDPMFMSKHFALSSSDFENLKLDPNRNEIDAILGKEDMHSVLEEKHVLSAKGILKETCKLKPVDNLDSIRYFQKEKGLADSDIGFEEVKTLESHILFGSGEFDAFHAQPNLFCEGSSPCKDENDLHEPVSLDQPPSSPTYTLSDSISVEEHEHFESEMPDEVSWRKQAKLLFNQAKEAKAFWSILVAAAVVGLVIVGHRRQRAKVQVEPIRFRVTNADKSISPMWGLVNRFRGAFVSDQHNLPVNGSFKYGAVGASF